MDVTVKTSDLNVKAEDVAEALYAREFYVHSVTVESRETGSTIDYWEEGGDY